MGQVRCAACQWLLEISAWNDPQGTYCRGCGQISRVTVFPAINRVNQAPELEAVQEDNEASCFYHPNTRAVLPCDECGRFLCHTCDCPLDGRHLCPNCLHVGASTKKILEFDNHRVMHDSIALSIATVPFFVWPFTVLTFITAPVAVYYGLRHWKSPLGILPRSKVRFVLAILFGVVLSLAWGAFAFSLLSLQRTP